MLIGMSAEQNTITVVVAKPSKMQLLLCFTTSGAVNPIDFMFEGHNVAAGSNNDPEIKACSALQCPYLYTGDELASLSVYFLTANDLSPKKKLTF